MTLRQLEDKFDELTDRRYVVTWCMSVMAIIKLVFLFINFLPDKQTIEPYRHITFGILIAIAIVYLILSVAWLVIDNMRDVVWDKMIDEIGDRYVRKK